MLPRSSLNNSKGKVKWSRYRPGVAQRVGRGIALLFHDRGTRRGEWSAARPGRTLPPGKTRYPFYMRLGGPQGRSGRAEDLVPTGIRSWTVQPVVSRYTDWTTRPTHIQISLKNISPPEGSTANTEGARIPPSNVFPVPKSKAAIKRGRSARRSQIMTRCPFKNSLLNVTKKRRAKDQTSQKRSSRMGLLLDSHRAQERKWRKRRIFFVEGAMRNMNSQINKTAYSPWNAKDSGTSSGLRLKEI